MADQTTGNSTTPAPSDQPQPKKRGGWGKRILIGAVVLVVVLLVLVALIPTIAGMGFVRNIVVGKVNENLNGTVAIESYSLSWTGGIDASGISVADTAGQKVVELKKVHTDLSLFDAIKGKYDLGKVTVDGLRANVVMNADGSNNLQKLAKVQPAGPATPAPSQPAAPAQASAPAASSSSGGGLPNIKADVVLTDCQATVSGAGVPEVVTATFAGQVTIPDLNQTITDSINAAVAVGNQAPGKIDLSGTANLFKNGQFDDKTGSLAQKLTITGVQLASVAPVLPKTAVTSLAGVTDGNFSVELKGGTAAVVQGVVTTKGLSASGPALSGDTFKSDAVVVTIPATVVAMPGGMGDSRSFHIKTGGDAVAPVTVTLGKSPAGEELGGVQVLMDAGLGAIMNVAGGKAPGSEGKVVASENFDVAALSRLMPRTMKVIDGVQIQSGKLAGQNTITLTAQQGTVQSVTDISAITGTDTRTNKAITIRPIHLDAAGTAGGNGSMDFRNVALNLTSGFATAAFKGQTIADLTGQAHSDLKAMRDELGQVVDFGKLDLGGTFDMTLASTGNLAEEKGKGDVKTELTFQNLRVAGLAEGKTIDQKWMNVTATASLVRGPVKFLDAVNNAVLTVKTGDPANPTIDVVTNANVNLAGATPTVGFALQKLFVDAAKAQAEFSAFVPGDYKVTGGTLNATASGTWSGRTLQLQGFNAQPANLTVNLVGKDGKSTQVVNALTMNVETAGTVVTGDQQTINLSKLNVTEQNKRLVLQKVSDGPLVVTMGPAGFAGNGKLQVGADLAFVNALVQAVTAGGQQVVAQTKTGDVKSGMLDGTLGFDSASGKPTNVAGDFKISNLVVTMASGDSQPQAVALALAATAPADFSSVSAQSVSLKSAFANVAVTDALLLLKDPAKPTTKPAVWDQLQRANVAVDVLDVGEAYTIANAFMPAATGGSAAGAPSVGQRMQNAVNRAGTTGAQVIARVADASGHPLPVASAADQLAGPLTVTGGHAVVKLNVARASGVTTVNLTDLSGGDIQLRRGTKAYTVQPFTMQLAAALKTNADAIAEIDVSQLNGKLGIADLTMDQPISIKNPGGDQMSAGGAVKLAGQLQQASDLLQVVQGKPIPYTGAYVLTQKLNTAGDSVGLTGNVDVTNFQVLDEAGKVSFAEDKVAVVNDLKIDQKAKNLTGNLSVDSKAVGVKFNGGVNGFDVVRKITDGTTLVLNYDAAKVWQIVKPMMSAESQASLADLQIAGVKQATFKVGGSFPANETFQRAVVNLTASGALPLDSLSTQGINATQINPGFTLAGGKLTVTAGPGATAPPAAPPAAGAKAVAAPAAAGASSRPAMPPMVMTAMVNGGTVDLTNAVIDLTTPEPTLTTPANKALAHNIALNAILAQYANKAIPVFDTANQSAVADVTLVRCDKLPLGKSMTAPNNGGTAEIVVALSNVKPGGPIIGGLDQWVGGFFGTSAQATVQPTTIVIANGTARISNFALAIGEGQRQYLKMNGTVSLADNGPLDLTANLPSDLIKRFGKDVIKYLPAGVDLPIGGTKEKPQFAGGDKVLSSLLKQAVTNAALGGLTGNKKDGSKEGGLGGLLGNVLGGNQDQAQQPAPAQAVPGQTAVPANQQAPAQAQPAESATDAIGGLLNSLGGKDKKKADAKKAEKKAAATQPAKRK